MRKILFVFAIAALAGGAFVTDAVAQHGTPFIFLVPFSAILGGRMHIGFRSHIYQSRAFSSSSGSSSSLLHPTSVSSRTLNLSSNSLPLVLSFGSVREPS